MPWDLTPLKRPSTRYALPVGCLYWMSCQMETAMQSNDGRTSVRSFLYACLMLAMLTACGGEKEPSLPTASASVSRKAPPSPASMTASAAISAAEKPAPSAAADRPAAMSSIELVRFRRLAALPLLASLSDREKADLLRQLRMASPSERLTLINGFKSLEGLPDQQKQVLLGQLEDIVPVTTPAARLVCNCSNDIKRELCVKESCSSRSELESICSRACGTLAAFGHQCTAAPQCVSR